MSSSEEVMKNKDELHAVMFPFLAFGHINPFVQLSNKLFSQGLKITFLSASSNIHRIRSTLNLNPSITIIPLEFPNGENITSTAELPPELAKNLVHAVSSTQPHVKSLLQQLKPHYVFFDFAQNWLPKIASQLGVKSIRFSIFPAISDAYLTVPSRLEGKGNITNFEDLKKPPKGYPQSNISLKSFEAMDLMFLFTRFGGENDVTGYERVLQGFTDCSYVMFRSCREMEGPYIDYIEKQLNKRVLLTGPLVPEPSIDMLEEKWSKWLDNFPTKSVVYCSFGSEGFLNDDQIREVATGLELTGLPFILVLNFPSNLSAEGELERALPKGFLERVKERGVVHTGWLQQQVILKHPSIGCHLSHGGFSSVVEAISNDCQLVILPLKADQFFNSKLISKDMEAGIEVHRKDEDGYFSKEDVTKAVKSIMVEGEIEPAGKSIRENHMKWKMFLLNKEIQDKFITDLVSQMKSLV